MLCIGIYPIYVSIIKCNSLCQLFRMCPDQIVDFDQNVKLDIPEEGVVLQSGWSITPLSTTVVSLLASFEFSYQYRGHPRLIIIEILCRKIVQSTVGNNMNPSYNKPHDVFFCLFLLCCCCSQISQRQLRPNLRAPCCRLRVQWTKPKEDPVELCHRIKLLGAKPPHNFIPLTIEPPSQPSLGTKCVVS